MAYDGSLIFDTKIDLKGYESGLKKIEASAGGGMVNVIISGNRQILNLHIDPQVIDPKDPQMLQDLIMAALNQGLQKVRLLEEEELQKTASGLGLPNRLL